VNGAWLGLLWIGLLGATISTSCALLTPVTTETQKETLTKTPVELPGGKMLPGTLLILPPEVSAAYDTTQMAYEVRPHEIAYFVRTEWAEKPRRMLHRLLVQTLQRAGYFRSVVTPPFMGRYTHALRTEILTFRQDFDVEPASFQLDLRVQLTIEPGNHVLATKEIRVREPMRQRTAYAGVVAANDATAKALKELAAFVCAQTL
jgi:cholesterol transport system auxiliary component